MKTGICISPSAALRDENPFPITDEICMGWAVGILDETPEAYHVVTHYGYKGFVGKKHIRITELNDRDSLLCIAFPLCDVMSQDDVESEILVTLPLGSFVWAADEKDYDGYRLIRTVTGTVGYVPARALQPRKDSDGFLMTPDKSFFLSQSVADEQTFRDEVVRNCRLFMNVQYRWGGKTGTGIDCSGLAFMGYMLAGVLIYRDADIKPDYPLKQIPASALKKGDLIFFPGHVAIYMGEGKYIHSTAHRDAFSLTVNSLDPQDDDYREDLAKGITACGSLFI